MLECKENLRTGSFVDDMVAIPTEVHCVLQAGGRGERMTTGGSDAPKPLRAIGGIPMLERLLRSVVACGVRRVTVITGWRGDEIESFVHGLTDFPDDLVLDCMRETEPRGNIGSLSSIRHEGATVLMAFADLVTDLDFARLIEIHRTRGAAVTLTSHYESHRVRLGELIVDEDTVLDYREKPEKKFLICSGIAAFQPEVLALVREDRPIGISDLIRDAIAAGHKVTHWLHGAFWMDINSPEELEQAEKGVKSCL